MPDLRNIILITIDSLRPDWVTPDSSTSKAFPTLRSLWIGGISCPSGFSHGLFSQISFPSILTSTLPLDYGGYDGGIRSRPVTLAEVCREHGLRTAAFSSDPYLSPFYGYDRGFESFSEMYDVARFLRNLDKLYLQPYISLRADGRRTDDSLTMRVANLLAEAFDGLLGLCERKQEELGRFRFWSESVADHYNFHRLARLIDTELSRLRQDPRAYVERLFAELGDSAISDIPKRADISILRPFLRRIWRAYKRLTPGGAQASAVAVARAGVSLTALAPSYVSATHVIRKAGSWLARTSESPFFAWIALNDPHELSFARAMSPLAIRRSFRMMKRTLRGPEILYALSLRYVDAALGSLIRFLRKRGRLDDTLLVICSDHGRAFSSQLQSARTFSEEMLRVPMVFWNPHLTPTEAPHPCGLIDLAPTILDLMGWQPVPGFQGVPVYSDAASRREALIVDGMNGPCDFELQRPSIGVLRDDRLFLWHGNDPIEVTDFGGREPTSADRRQDASNASQLEEARRTAADRWESLLSSHANEATE